MLINDQEVNIKDWELITINNDIDLNEEYKLRNKSLFNEYMKSKYEKLDETEELNTINLIIDQINEYISENTLSINDFNLVPRISRLNFRQIIKLFEFNIIKEDLIASQYDLSYEDKILLQIEILKEITKNNYAKNYLVVVDIAKLTSKIYEKLNSLEIENLYILCFTNECLKNIDINNIYNIENKNLDFSNEVSLYNEILLEAENKIFIEDLKLTLKEIVEGIDNDGTRKVKTLL